MAGGRRRDDHPPILDSRATLDDLDLLHVKGQEAAKRAVEVAAAGDHSLLLIPPRAGGKTMLARCLPGLLAPPTGEEAEEIAEVYRGAKLDPPSGRPFRAPHFSIRPTGLIGGGRKPGEVDLARGGALFMDDLPAFGKRSLRAIRPLLEDDAPELSTGSGVDTRSRFMLVAAMRSCPCGHLHDWRRDCTCTRWEIARYWAAVEELVLDLVHLYVEVPTVSLSELRSRYGETSAPVAARIREARARQLGREGQDTWNAHLRPWALPKFCEPDANGRKLLDTAYERLGLTVRELASTLQIARTIADLAGSEVVRAPHVAEAIQYRALSRRPGRARDDEGQS
jgi:magnesium chelatase family protein